MNRTTARDAAFGRRGTCSCVASVAGVGAWSSWRGDFRVTRGGLRVCTFSCRKSRLQLAIRSLLNLT
jgi:hypothetical protein